MPSQGTSVTATELARVLEAHAKWWRGEAGGSRADLRRANLRDADLSDADLSGANLRDANLSDANLSGADLRDANLSRADLRRANLRDADLSDANLSGADLSDADLSGANLRGANLSGAAAVLDPIDYLATHFEATADGYVVYKTFGANYAPNPAWTIEAGAVLTETCNPDRGTDCGSGINVAPLAWVERHADGTVRPVWKCLIRWAWLPGVVVPFGTEGKIRCGRVELLGLVEREP